MTSKEAFDIEAARRGRNLATRYMVSSFTYRADVNAFCRGRGIKPDLFDVKDDKENRKQLVVNHGIGGLLSQPIYNQWKRKDFELLRTTHKHRQLACLVDICVN
jgi:hypothetical protein